MIRRYEKYKNSGVEWIGEIPEGWEAYSLKHCVETRITDGPHETPEFILEGIPFVSAEAIQNGAINFDSIRGYISEADDKRFSLKCKPQKDDIFIVKSGSTTGKIGYVDSDINFNIWSPLALVRASNNNFSKYLYHFLQSDLFQTQVQLSWSFGTQPNIGMNVIENLKIIVPSRPEQTAIASFLDRKTAEIDQLIANKEKLIALYEEEKTTIINHTVTKGLDPRVKTKSSGVDWLGDIPEHWTIKRLKFLSDIQTGSRDTENREDDGEYPFYVRSQTVERISTYSFDGEAILTAGDGVGVGKVFHYANGKFDYHQRVYRISDFVDVQGKLLFYFMKSYFYKEVIRLSAKSTVDSLRLPMLQDFPVVIPIIEEQIAIVAHIESECLRLDTIIDKFKKQIELFKQYRTTLISEVVTGKIDVRDEVAS